MKARIYVLGVQSMGGCWFCHPDSGYSNWLTAENALDALRAKDPLSKDDRIFELTLMNQDIVESKWWDEAINATEFSPRKDRIIMAKEAYQQGRTHDAVLLLLAASHARSPA